MIVLAGQDDSSTDFHVHFSGAIPRGAVPYPYDPPQTYHEFFATYQRRKEDISAALGSATDIYRYGTAAILIEACSQGIDAIELIVGVAGDTTGPVARIDQTELGLALANTICEQHFGRRAPDLHLRLSFIRHPSQSRFVNAPDLDQVLRAISGLAAPGYSLDICGEEHSLIASAELDLIGRVDRLNEARSRRGLGNLNISCHAGEHLRMDNNWALERIEQLVHAGVTRFAHLNILWANELSSGDNKQAMRIIDLLRSVDAHLDICPTSTQRLTSPAAMQWPESVGRLRGLGLKLKVGTDNPAIFRTTLASERSLLDVSALRTSPQRQQGLAGAIANWRHKVGPTS